MNSLRILGAIMMAIWLLLTAVTVWAAVIAWPISIPLALIGLPLVVLLALIWAAWFVVALALLIL
jgi:hypothetical protein